MERGRREALDEAAKGQGSEGWLDCRKEGARYRREGRGCEEIKGSNNEVREGRSEAGKETYLRAGRVKGGLHQT